MCGNGLIRLAQTRVVTAQAAATVEEVKTAEAA